MPKGGRQPEIMAETLLEMQGITKQYGGILALDSVNFKLYQGELLCLLGENGAGKSTLMKILSGVEQPSAGEIVFAGAKVNIPNADKAHLLGISTVYQELVQFPDMTISENIFMGRHPKKMGLCSFKELRKMTLALMNQVNIHFDPDTYIRNLSVAQRQLVEIMKAVSFNAKVIIFDEPTSSLTREETDILFRIIAQLKADGVSIIYISHRLEDIFAIGDRAVVLRDGRNSGEGLVKDLSRDDIISMMVGRSLENQFPKEKVAPGSEVLRVEGITNQWVKGASFTLRKGEVLGFGGLIGAGRTELMRAIMGLDKAAGTVYLHGEKVANKSPQGAIKNHFAMVPEDRKDQGLVLIRTILHNLEMSSLPALSTAGFMRGAAERRNAMEFVGKLHIKSAGIYQHAGSLSGGNQQKVVLGKCLATKPEILILDEPTRGIDVGSKAEIYEIMNELAAEGVAIIMVSSELPELLNMSDRIIVMREGVITGELNAAGATEESIMKLATEEVQAV